MRLLTGSSSLTSALLIKKATDGRLLAQFNQAVSEYGLSEPTYQPWMSSTGAESKIAFAAAHEKLRLDPFRFAPNSRFLNLGELLHLNQFMVSTLMQRDPDKSVLGFEWCNPNANQLRAFNDSIHEAEEELTRIQPHYAVLIENLIQGYVPIVDAHRTRQDFGISTVGMKGVVYFNLYQEASLQRRVENLAHELAHQILIHYQLNDFLIEPTQLKTPTFSGIRNTERPAILALHGAAALSAILENARAQKDSLREKQAHHWLTTTLEGLRKFTFTDVGALILAEVSDVL